MKESLRDAAQLFVVPFVAACLPWRWGFRLLRRISRMRWIFPQETAQALAGAESLAPIADPAEWAANHRLVRLVDHADLYLSLLRSDRWLARHLRVQGQWPQGGPFLAAFFHWGAGLWGLRHLRSSNNPVTFLSVHFDRDTFRHAKVRFWYARLRAWETARAAGSPVIYTGNAPAEMRRLYREGRNVTAALDVPFAQTRKRLDARLFGRPSTLPAGVIRIVVRMRVPIMMFSVGLDHATGQRLLKISGPLGGMDDETLAARFAQELETLVASDPPAWHMWPHVTDFFLDPTSAPQPGEAAQSGHVARPC